MSQRPGQKMAILLMVVIKSLSTSVSVENVTQYRDCAQPSYHYSKSVYHFPNDAESWTDARAKCRQRGMDLFTMHSHIDQSLFRSLHRDGVFADTERIWLGATRADSPRRFCWIDGGVVPFGERFWTADDDWLGKSHHQKPACLMVRTAPPGVGKFVVETYCSRVRPRQINLCQNVTPSSAIDLLSANTTITTPLPSISTSTVQTQRQTETQRNLDILTRGPPKENYNFRHSKPKYHDSTKRFITKWHQTASRSSPRIENTTMSILTITTETTTAPSTIYHKTTTKTPKIKVIRKRSASIKDSKPKLISAAEPITTNIPSSQTTKISTSAVSDLSMTVIQKKPTTRKTKSNVTDRVKVKPFTNRAKRLSGLQTSKIPDPTTSTTTSTSCSPVTSTTKTPSTSNGKKATLPVKTTRRKTVPESGPHFLINLDKFYTVYHQNWIPTETPQTKKVSNTFQSSSYATTQTAKQTTDKTPYILKTEPSRKKKTYFTSQTDKKGGKSSKHEAPFPFKYQRIRDSNNGPSKSRVSKIAVIDSKSTTTNPPTRVTEVTTTKPPETTSRIPERLNSHLTNFKALSNMYKERKRTSGEIPNTINLRVPPQLV